MKKIILLFVTSVLLTFNGSTQILRAGKDSTIIANKDLKRKLEIISDCKLYKTKTEELFVKFETDLILTDSLLRGKDRVIGLLQEANEASIKSGESKDRQLSVKDKIIKQDAIDLKLAKKDGNKKGKNGFLQGTAFGVAIAIAAKFILF